MSSLIDRIGRRMHRDPRAQRVMLASAASVISRIISIATGLAQVPIVLGYLGAEGFGLWMTIFSIVQLMGVADFGIGLGMQNRISAAYGREAWEEIRDTVVTGKRILLAVGSVLFLLGVPIAYYVPLSLLLPIKSATLTAELPFALALSTAIFCVGLPTSIGARYATAMQLGWQTGIAAGTSNLLTLCLCWLVSRFDGGFALILASLLLPPIASNIYLGRITTNYVDKMAPKGIGRFRRDWISEFYKTGAMFLLPQVCASILSSVPNIAIAAVLGPLALGAYSVCQRIANTVIQVVQMPIVPLWPAYAEAKAKNDIGWIKATFIRSFIFAAGFGVISGGALWIFGRHIIYLWTANLEVVPTPWLLSGFSLWVVSVSTMCPITFLLNGLGCLRSQAIGGVVSVALILVTSRWFIFTYGPAGAVYNLLICWMVATWPLVIIDLLKLRIKMQHGVGGVI